MNTAFSRSGSSNPDGKLTQRIDVPCTDRLYDSLTALAVLAKKSKAEYVRAILEQHCFGRLDYVANLANNDDGGDGRNMG